MMETIVSARNVYKCFQTGEKEDFFALKNINIDIPKGKLTILKGRSGSGKTTLMNLLSTLDTQSEQRPQEVPYVESDICFGELHYHELSKGQKEQLRRRQIGFVFQAVALIPLMNAYENLDFALRLSEYGQQGITGKNRYREIERLRDERIKEVLSLVGLRERMLHLPAQMSGGEQQRVAIARALAPRPQIIFADEPTGALDTQSGLRVMKLFQRLIEVEHTTIVMTTHDPGLMELGDMIYEMEDGELIDRRENGS